MSNKTFEQKPCGASGLRLPVLGIGCWAFGGGAYWGRQSPADVEAVVGRALDLGLNYFDTAEGYNEGLSEESLGAVLRGRRNEAIIGSKISPHHAYPDVLRHHCEQSLRRLGTDYIDLYMIHWPLNGRSLRHFTSDETLISHPPALSQALDEMDGLRREGKIRYVGLSNFGPSQLAEAVRMGVPIAVNEVPYNLLMRGAENEILPFCVEHGIGVLGYSALMQGLLAGPFDAFDDLPPIRLRSRHFSSSREGARHGESGIEADTLAALKAVRQIAEKERQPLVEIALTWAAANEAIGCTLVGCRDLLQLEENLHGLDHPMALETKRRLDQATHAVKAKLGDGIDYFQGKNDTRSW